VQPRFPCADSIAVVTGGASGIGKALCRELLGRGARCVVAADVQEDAVASCAQDLNARFGTGRCVAAPLDVGCETSVRALIVRVEEEIGPITAWYSNAGVHRGSGLGEPSDWELSLKVNLLAHVVAVRHLLPRMLDRRSGHFVITASAAGLLSDVRSAAYTASKHAAVAFAEWLAIQHAESGVGIHCICPEAVRTGMTRPTAATALPKHTVLEADEVAHTVLDSLGEGRFLILPHPRVEEYERRRVADRPRWLQAMHVIATQTQPGSSPPGAQPRPQA
jgi:NAD(P)-dependent dehydrogenase (short-subunit alcohol dehydrogenase family)